MIMINIMIKILEVEAKSKPQFTIRYSESHLKINKFQTHYYNVCDQLSNSWNHSNKTAIRKYENTVKNK